MRKSIKSLSLLIVLVVCFIQMSVFAVAKTNIPAATNDFYVNDFAGVFSESEKADLIEKATDLAETHDGIQVVISTVESLDGKSPEKYATEMYNQYGIGKDDMGLLILLSTGDRQIRVEVGRKMEAYITDSKAGSFIDKYAIPYLKDNKFNEGLISLQNELILEIKSKIYSEKFKTLEKSAPITTTDDSTTEAVNEDSKHILPVVLFAFLIISIVFLLLIAIGAIINKVKSTKQNIESLTNQLEKSKAKLETESLEHERSLGLVKEQYESRQRDYENQLRTSRSDNQKISSNYSKLKDDFERLSDRYQRAQKLYPTLDAEIDSVIAEEIKQADMKKAMQVDLKISEVLGYTASKDNVDLFNSALCSYNGLEKRQMKYVTGDINKVKQLYDNSVTLEREYKKKLEEERKAKEEAKRKKEASAAIASILAIIGGISYGKSRDLRRLKEAKRTYDNLDSATKKYADSTVIDKLDKLIREAKKAQEEEEEEERRRKRREKEERRRRSSYSSSYSSHSSFGGSTFHSGFGGHSGGGGAGRGF